MNNDNIILYVIYYSEYIHSHELFGIIEYTYILLLLHNSLITHRLGASMAWIINLEVDI